MNYHSDEWIMERIQEHYQEALNFFPEHRIVGIFCQGSQNYGVDYKNSDIDTKLIVLPSIEDIIFNKSPVSTTHIRKNDEHIDFKDFRLYRKCFEKQNLNFLEILFTKFKIVNPKYESMWNVLVEHREGIARYNEFRAINSMKGIAMKKYFDMERPYPSKLDVLAKWGYDPKQLHHLLRVEEYIERYINGEKYEDCLYPRRLEYLSNVKKGLYDLDAAREIAKTAIDNVIHISEEFIKTAKNIENPKITAILDEVQKDIMKLAIASELKREEYYI